MKRNHLLLSVLATLAIVFMVSCNNQQSGSNGQETEQTASIDQDWEAAKEAYHTVMSGTFHPAEEGNLEPLKEKYAELATRSQEWAALPIPENLQGKGLEEALKELETTSAAMGQVVTTGTDEEITKAIYDLHDVFHRIVGLCEH